MNARNNTLASGNNEYFDLNEYVGSIPVAYVAAQVAQSTAWRFDTLLVSKSRELFKAIRQDLYEAQVSGLERMAEITTALGEKDFAEESFEQAGGSHEGVIETIRALNAQRDQWHDLATELTSLTSDWTGSPKVYEAPTLEDVFYRDPNMKVGTDTQRRLRMSATRTAEAFGGDAEMAQRMYERKLGRQQSKLGDVSENLKQQAPAVFLMFSLALRGDDVGAAVRSKDFWALPIDSQRVLLENAAAAAARADEYAASERNMSDYEYDLILAQALKVQTDVKKLLSGQRFVQALRVQQATDKLAV